MPFYDFRTPRLHVSDPLQAGASIGLDGAQSHYLRNVLRRREGDSVLIFNGRDGEWGARISASPKRNLTLAVERRLREQTEPLDLHYCFSPLKHSRLDYMVQKAVEMGVSRLQPVMTHHTQATRVNLERMRANAVEAAEQCGILTLPEIKAPIGLDGLIAEHPPLRLLVFCDEAAEVRDPIAVLTEKVPGHRTRAAVTVLIGPEGGFADDERTTLMSAPNAVRLSLGPRILRADTAAIAALTLVGAVLGDWR